MWAIERATIRSRLGVDLTAGFEQVPPVGLSGTLNTGHGTRAFPNPGALFRLWDLVVLAAVCPNRRVCQESA